MADYGFRTYAAGQIRRMEFNLTIECLVSSCRFLFQWPLHCTVRFVLFVCQFFQSTGWKVYMTGGDIAVLLLFRSLMAGIDLGRNFCRIDSRASREHWRDSKGDSRLKPSLSSMLEPSKLWSPSSSLTSLSDWLSFIISHT